MSTSGWSLPARAKTRGLGLPPALSQLRVSSFGSRIVGESIFLRGPAKIRARPA